VGGGRWGGCRVAHQRAALLSRSWGSLPYLMPSKVRAGWPLGLQLLGWPHRLQQLLWRRLLLPLPQGLLAHRAGQRR
jgi:hypothetical protein